MPIDFFSTTINFEIAQYADRREMKVAITGSNGFLGAWSSHLLSQNSDVLCLTRPDADLFRLEDSGDLKIQSAPTEIWPNLINEFQPDAVIFFHWEGVSGQSRNEDLQQLNVESNRVLLTSIDVDCHLIGVGSQAELGPVSGKISESQQDNPTTKYGVAKVQTRKTYFDSSVSQGRKVSWARIFSTYGQLDNPNWLIPSLIEKLKSNEEFHMTKGEQKWSYLHAYDAALAFEKIIYSKPASPVINLGNPNTVILSELAKTIAVSMSKIDLLKLGTIEYRPDQVMELIPLCETLTSMGWQPKIDINEGIEEMIKSFSNTNFSINSFIRKLTMNGSV